MAIEFNCPFCTSPIRVPDSASGKRGVCPRCKSKILVPKIKKQKQKGRGQQQSAKPEQESPEEPSAKSRKKKPLTERFTEEPDFSNFAGVERETLPAEVAPAPMATAAPSPGATTATPVTRALKRRRRRKGNWWIPVTFGLLLVGGLIVFLVLNQQSRLTGSLTARVVPNEAVKPQFIRAGQVGADKESVDAVLQYLQENAISFSQFSLSATEAGLSVQLRETSAREFYEVRLGNAKSLLRYFADKGEEFDKRRDRDFRKGLTAFFEDAAKEIRNNGHIPDDLLKQFQSRVLANAFIDAKGYHLIASIDGQAHPCLYQQGNRLIFLLPKGTKAFRIRGRKMPDGERLVNANYTVEVEVPTANAEQEPPPEKTDGEESPSKSE